MALRKCRECGNYVSTKAKACPACGAPNKSRSSPLRLGCAGVFILFGIVVCAGLFSTRDRPNLRERRDAPGGASTRRVAVSRDQFGDEWPLTVEIGEVECIDGFVAVFHQNGKAWALNGAAQTRGYPEIDPIWRDNPSIPGAKVDIGVLTELALKQCE